VVVTRVATSNTTSSQPERREAEGFKFSWVVDFEGLAGRVALPNKATTKELTRKDNIEHDTDCEAERKEIISES